MRRLAVQSLQVQVVEGNPHLRSLLRWHLQQMGHSVQATADLTQARLHLQTTATHLLVLDADLPQSYDLCRWVHRQMDSLIFVLGSSTTEGDVLNLFEAGADDYLSKPMNMQIFMARLAALARRWQRQTPAAAMTCGCLRMDLVQRQVFLSGQMIDLTPQEFSLLFVLVQASSQCLSRSELLQRAWSNTIDNPRTVDTHILSLRKKLEQDPANPVMIQTVRSVGYRFEPDATPNVSRWPSPVTAIAADLPA